MSLSQQQFNARMAALQADAQRAFDDMQAHQITSKAFNEVMDKVEKQAARLHSDLTTTRYAKQMAMAGTPETLSDPNFRFGGGRGVVTKNLSPLDIPSDELHAMYEACRHKQPYRCEIKTKAFGGAGAPPVGFKTPGSPIAEGAPWPTGLFPPVLRPDLTQELRYEPDRLADHIPSITVDAPSIEYLVHTGNTNSASVVSELDPKPDLGMQLDTATAVPVKIAALASTSMEALADFSYFQDWVPRELSRAVINEETTQLVLGHRRLWSVSRHGGVHANRRCADAQLRSGCSHVGVRCADPSVHRHPRRPRVRQSNSDRAEPANVGCVEAHEDSERCVRAVDGEPQRVGCVGQPVRRAGRREHDDPDEHRRRG